MIIQIVRSLSNYGPKRFYIINAGVSTTPTLEIAAKTLAEEGIQWGGFQSMVRCKGGEVLGEEIVRSRFVDLKNSFHVVVLNRIFGLQF